jgi:putative selenium metabolism hydrolase
MSLFPILPPATSHRYRMTTDHANACTDFLQRMVRTPSLPGQEAAMGQLVLDELQSLGFRETHIDAVGNVVGKLGADEGPVLMFVAHLDTASVGEPTAWEVDPYGGDIVGDQLFGLGSVDGKGPLAGLVYGLSLLSAYQEELEGQIYVVATVQEVPAEGLALQALIEQSDIHPDWVVVAKPSGMKLIRGHRGRMEVRLSTFGRSSHAAMPEQGENALYAAARLIFGIELLSATLMSDPVLGKGTIAVTQLQTLSSARNAIPDRCNMIIDRRITLGETAPRVLSELDTLIQREGIRAEMSVAQYQQSTYTGYRLAGEAHYPAWLLGVGHPLLLQSTASMERSLGRKPEIDIWRFSSDGGYTMGVAGIPTIGFGPGDDLLSLAPNEFITLSALHRSIPAYANLARDLLHGLATMSG